MWGVSEILNQRTLVFSKWQSMVSLKRFSEAEVSVNTRLHRKPYFLLHLAESEASRAP